MSLDPELQVLLQALPTEIPLPIDWVGLRGAGQAMLSFMVGTNGLTPVQSVEDLEIAGAAGAVKVRIYRPTAPTSTTLIFLHGGGWATGDLDLVDPTVRTFCSVLPAVVVSCTYRLAPEHPFPAGYDDALAAAKWVLAHAPDLGGDPERVVIAGESAGANLAAAVTLALRAATREGAAHPPEKAMPALKAQLLLNPAVDLRASAWDAASCIADRDPTLRMALVSECVRAYLQGQGADDSRVSPLVADDLSDLPPALIVVLSVDPLRDQALAYAQRLRETGVPCEAIEFPHLNHGFVHLGVVPAARTAFGDVLARFRQLIESGAVTSDMHSRPSQHTERRGLASRE